MIYYLWRAAAAAALMSITHTQAAPLVIAHRGASRDAPENTLPAFEMAWAQGADGIEGDFQLTADGRIVCIHDKDTKRVAGRKRVVAESTLVELRELDFGKKKSRDFTGTHIPTLEEVLATVPDGKRMFIEVKCGPEIIPALIRSIDTSSVNRDQVTLISFDKQVIAEARKHAPEITANWLTDIKALGTKATRPGLAEILETLQSAGADGLGCRAHRHVREEFANAILTAGYTLHAWTVDDAATAQRLAALGFDSITTNVPGEMRAAFHK